MKKKILWAVVILAVIAAIAGLRITAINKTKYTHVKTEKAVRGTLYAYLSTTGTIESDNVKNYYGFQGKVKKVNVLVGDKVKKGDILVKYEVQDLNSVVEQAKIQYDNAVLSYEMLKKQKQSYKKPAVKASVSPTAAPSNSTSIIDPKAIQQLIASSSGSQSVQGVEISNEQLQQAKNAVTLAKLNLNSARENLKKMKDKLVSDINGVVTKVNVTEGAVDSGMQPAVVVQDLNNLKISAKIGRFDADKIKLGQSVIISNDNKRYKGVVNFIAPVASQEMSVAGTDTSMPIGIGVLSGKDELKVGFDTDIDILVASASNVIKVPAECVITDKKGRNFVYVVEDDKAVEKSVVLGIQSDTEVEVKKGLNENEKVILNPGSNLTNGSLVKVDSEVSD